MKRKTLRTLSSIMCLLFLVSIFQAPLLADTATIAVNVGGQTLNVTPGQWVTVKSAAGTSHYNVRFVDGKPVALEMSQYTQIVFGDGAAAGQAGQAAQTGQAAQSGQSAQTSQSSNQSSQTSQSNWDPAKHPRDPKTGKFISAEEASNIAQSNQSSGQSAQTNQGSSQSAQTNQGSSQSAQTNQSSGQSAQTNQGSSQSAQTNQGSSQSAQTNQGSNQSVQTGDAAQTSQSSSQTAQTETTVKKSNWDPAKHPRDPQTGKFISIEEAIERGLYEGGNTNAQASQGSGDTSQAAQTGGSGDASQAAQTDQSWDAAQTSGDSSQAAQQTSGDASQANQSAGENTKPGVGDKFKSGYETGKGMANQGFQNVKDSLKSGFSAKNILVTAGITVGVDLATQVMRGEQPSIKSALKTVASAEFVGGVTGSVLGAATGSFFTPFLAGIPVVGGALSALAPVFGSIVGSSMGAYLAGDLKNGRFSIKEAFKRIDWVGVTGQTIGSTAGAALGSFLGPVGTVVGGIVGGYVGNWAAQKIAGLFSKNKSADLPTITMPVGSGTGEAVVVGSTVSVGTSKDSGSNESATTTQTEINIPDANVNEISISGDFSANDAYEAYSMLYKEYSDLVAQGKMEEALKVAQQMNTAKALYDQLLQSGK
jgi:hypothetical protein